MYLQGIQYMIQTLLLNFPLGYILYIQQHWHQNNIQLGNLGNKKNLQQKMFLLYIYHKQFVQSYLHMNQQNILYRQKLLVQRMFQGDIDYIHENIEKKKYLLGRECKKKRHLLNMYRLDRYYNQQNQEKNKYLQGIPRMTQRLLQNYNNHLDIQYILKLLHLNKILFYI